MQDWDLLSDLSFSKQEMETILNSDKTNPSLNLEKSYLQNLQDRPAPNSEMRSKDDILKKIFDYVLLDYFDK